MLVPRWSRLVLQGLAREPTPRYRPVWSEWIIGETWRALARQRVEAAARSGRPVDWHTLGRHANEMMWHLLAVMTTVSLARRERLPEPWPSLGDPDDRPIWATARLAGAQYVVSHNTRHFPPLTQSRHVYEGIEYLTTIEFVGDILGVEVGDAYGQALPARNLIRSQRLPGAR